MADYLKGIIQWIAELFSPAPQTPLEAPKLPQDASAPLPPPSGPPTVPATVPESGAGLSWGNQKGAFKLTRIICDDIGLTFEQKEILCACVFQESRFRNWIAPGVPTTNGNKDKTGTVWSTDYGIVQVNDYFQIGPGKTFPSVAYVVNNPDKAIRWMAGIMKKTGKLQPWASYTSGAYRQWLSPTSPMQKLRS